MSEELKVPPVVRSVLTEEQIEAITGAGNTECALVNIESITSQLVGAYEDLVDFTSHVIQRVAGK